MSVRTLPTMCSGLRGCSGPLGMTTLLIRIAWACLLLAGAAPAQVPGEEGVSLRTMCHTNTGDSYTCHCDNITDIYQELPTNVTRL
ncbi:hypothetical protein Bpfe_027204, partial [Biomphalaria pfeifferi]